MNNDAQLKVADIGYGGDEFIDDYIEAIREKLIEKRRNVPHLKLFAIGDEEDFLKASLIGVDYDTEYDRKLEGQYEKLRVIVNVRATCESQLLNKLMEEALAETAEKHEFDYDVFFTECFGMMDEGLE